MKQAYKDWIVAKLATGSPYGRCDEWTREMQLAFPELRRERGHYLDVIWGPREHWWLIDDAIADDDAGGDVVDPTAEQFPTRGCGIYSTLDPNAPEPTGKCPECGEYCFDGRSFCCDAHERAFMTSL